MTLVYSTVVLPLKYSKFSLVYKIVFEKVSRIRLYIYTVVCRLHEGTQMTLRALKMCIIEWQTSKSRLLLTHVPFGNLNV